MSSLLTAAAPPPEVPPWPPGRLPGTSRGPSGVRAPRTGVTFADGVPGRRCPSPLPETRGAREADRLVRKDDAIFMRSRLACPRGHGEMGHPHLASGTRP